MQGVDYDFTGGGIQDSFMFVRQLLSKLTGEGGLGARLSLMFTSVTKSTVRCDGCGAATDTSEVVYNLEPILGLGRRGTFLDAAALLCPHTTKIKRFECTACPDRQKATITRGVAQAAELILVRIQTTLQDAMSSEVSIDPSSTFKMPLSGGDRCATL